MNYEQLATIMIQRLDGIIAWLTKISGLLEAKEVQGVSGQAAGQGFFNNTEAIDELLRLLVAQVLPSSPSRTSETRVNSITPTLLYSNDSTTFQRVVITNDDVAQPIWIGDRNVSLLIGEVMIAQDQRIFVVPRGASIYAICAVATVSVRISEGYNLVDMMRPLG